MCRKRHFVSACLVVSWLMAMTGQTSGQSPSSQCASSQDSSSQDSSSQDSSSQGTGESVGHKSKTNQAPESADQGASDDAPEGVVENWNLSFKTMGGKQFWTDVQHFHGYRIQKNVTTGHYRLLNGDDIRKAWGGREQCQKKLQEIAQAESLEPMTGTVLIVLHGLTRTRLAMEPICKYIEDHSELTILNVGYASTRDSIVSHAAALASIIDHLPEVEEINLLGHSMGNIVVRYYLGQLSKQNVVDPRFKRMVMLAPPNQGSRFARYLHDNFVFKTIWGVSGQELAGGWQEIESSLATPSFEFGIIAGAQNDGAKISNTLLPGKDDFVLTLEETRLPGAADFYVKPLWHSTMMKDTEVHRAALNFLQFGYFGSAEKKQPIPAETERPCDRPPSPAPADDDRQR